MQAKKSTKSLQDLGAMFGREPEAEQIRPALRVVKHDERAREQRRNLSFDERSSLGFAFYDFYTGHGYPESEEDWKYETEFLDRLGVPEYLDQCNERESRLLNSNK